MVIDPGLSTEEKVFVGSRSSGSLSSVTRGVDGTLAASHDSGATCYPVFTSIDADQANKLASTMTTKGDLVSNDGSDPARLGVGTNNHRLVAASGETTGLKWVADTQNTVIDAKGDLLVGSAADTVARLAVGGTNGQALVVDSGATNGVKWAEAGGLVYLGVQTVTGSTATVEFSNIFSSEYANYRFVISDLLCDTQGVLYGYMGTTLGATGYFSSAYYDRADGGLTGTVRGNDVGAWYIGLSDNAAGSISSYTFDVIDPQRATRTGFMGNYMGRVSYAGWAAGGNNTNTQYTTMRFYNSIGNITQGTFRCYGYRQV
jgi:hypothetical protein